MPSSWTRSLLGVAASAAVWALGCERGAPSSSAADAGSRLAAAPLVQPGFDLEREVATIASGGRVNFDATEDAECVAYSRLQRGASDDQLRRLLRHSSAAVRVYAFHALAERHLESSLFSELSPFLRDSATVETGRCCDCCDCGDRSEMQVPVVDLVLSKVEDRLSEAERDAILRDGLAGGGRPEVTAHAKRTWKFGEELHETLRDLVRRGDADALIALARYRDRSDVPTIAAALETERRKTALEAIATFPDPGFVAPLSKLQQRLLAERFASDEPFSSGPESGVTWRGWNRRGLIAEVLARAISPLCQFYATASYFPLAVKRAWFAAPFQPASRVADPAAHAKCLAWLLSPELIGRYPEAGFGLWSRARTISVQQARALWEADPQRAARVVVDAAPHLDEYDRETAIWMHRQLELHRDRGRALADGRAALRKADAESRDLLGDAFGLGEYGLETPSWALSQQERHPDRGRALADVRAALPQADAESLDRLGEVIRELELRELIPDLLALLQQTQPLADKSMTAFRAYAARPLVYTLARLELSAAEKQQLVRWVIDGRAARERATHDPAGQRILEDLLTDMLRRKGLLDR